LFTGLIEELGTLVDLKASGTSLCLKIEAERVFSGSSPSVQNGQNGLKIGDSIAVNGVCLTATAVKPPYFEVTAVEETLRKTTLGSLITGKGSSTALEDSSKRLNLERAATLETRLGGHLVQGHVDTTAAVHEIAERDGSWEFTFELPAADAKYIVPKGSIALDGVSLTVAKVEQISVCERVTIAVIPHTYYHTTFQFLKPGVRVNVEYDVIAKMVERLVGTARV